MTDPSLRLRLDAIIGLLALVVVSLGLLMVVLGDTLGLAFFLVVLVLGVVATRSYLLALYRGLTGEAEIE